MMRSIAFKNRSTTSSVRSMGKIGGWLLEAVDLNHQLDSHIYLLEDYGLNEPLRGPINTSAVLRKEK